MGEGIKVRRSGGGNKVVFTSYTGTNRILITAGSIYNFTGSETTAATTTLLTVATPITGYIKYKKGAF